MANSGSVWRKWNFHVHTKGTNKNDQFISHTLDDFFYTFFKKAFDEKVEAIGITDYFSIEKYIAAVEFVQNIECKIDTTTGEKAFTEEEVEFIKKIFLFPNVELRMPPTTGKGRLINIHCLFNPHYVVHLDNHFFGHISNQDGKKMNRNGLIEYGRSLDSTLTDDNSRYKMGVDNYVVELGALKELLATNNEFRDNCILVVSNSNNDGASGTQTHYDLFNNESGSLDGLRSSIYKISDGIFSTNPKDISYFLGKRLEGSEGYNEEIYQKEVEDVITQRGSLKPCIVGCDSHTESSLFNKFTWIKSDLSFEGLRQICFEPEHRVKIQSTKPDFKEDKVIIDKVRFISPSNVFRNEEILLNPNLNVIIGGKSSGKSILLYSIAKTLLPEQDILLNDDKEEKYNLKSIDKDFNFEITTRAKISQQMFRDVGVNSIIPDIKYIPQNYLVKLAEPEVNKKGRSLNKLVRELINEDPDSKLEYELFTKGVKQIDKERDSLIDNYFELLDDINGLESELRTKSSQDVLNANISNNEKKVGELNKEAGLSPDELERYKDVQDKHQLNKQKRATFNSDYKQITSGLQDLLQHMENAVMMKNFFINNVFSDRLKQYYSEKLEQIDLARNCLTELIEETKSAINDEGTRHFIIESALKNELLNIELERTNINNELIPFQKNAVLQKQISELNESISTDKRFLGEIEFLNKQIVDKKLAKEKCYNSIFDLYERTYNLYEDVIGKLKNRTNELEKDGLKIDGITQFNYPKYFKEIFDISDGRKSHYNNYPEVLNQTKKGTSIFQFDKFKPELERLFIDIIENRFALLTKVNKKEAIKKVMYDHFFDYWKITYKDDRLGEMSTGKASFVILMLIIGLSISKSPILIDQPEDNLDNRSITKDLVGYLRNKKLERQIIIVTHNANIVVNADSENVIVANQKGQGDMESNSKYTFDYVNGAIENSSPVNSAEKNLLKSMGIREHIADIVEGGKNAFISRERKYRFEKKSLKGHS